MLTTAAETKVLTTGNDTVDATVANSLEGDIIIDQGGTDTLNAKLSANLTAATTVSGVENINIEWDAFATPTIALDKVTGATVTLTSSKVGYLGSANVDGAGANKVVAGAGMVGTLDVDGATTSTVDAGGAKTVDITSAGTAAADDTLALTAASATTVTVADFNSGSITALVATAFNVTDDDAASDDEDTLTITYGKNATVTNNVDDLTVIANATGLTLTVDTIDASLTVAGTNATTIRIDDATDFDGETVTKTSTGSVTLAIDDIDGASNLNKVTADLITVAAASVGGNLTVKSGQALSFTGTMASNFGVTVAGAGTADTASITLDDDQTAIINFTGIETATINANATVSSSAVDLTLAEINAGTNKVVLTGANDVTITLAEAGELNASALTNNLVVTQDADADMNILGGTKKNTVVFKGTTNDNTFVGQDDVDNITFATTSGAAVATLGAGNNIVAADDLADGTLVVTAGAGNDSVNMDALDSGTVNLSLGDGTNTFAFGADGNLDAANITVTTGAGNDTVTVEDDTTANTVLALTFGGGTNTLDLSNGVDITAGSITVDGLTTIAIGSADTSAVVNAALLSGKSYKVTGDGTIGDHLAVEMDEAGSVDFSSIEIDQTITKGLGGLDITGSATNDTIVGSAGADIITGGLGTNVITGGEGADSLTAAGAVDTFVYASGDVSATVFDDITTFNTATDFIKTGTAATVTNYLEVDGNFADAGTNAQNVAAAVLDAEAVFDGTVQYAFIFNTHVGAQADGYLIADMNLDGTADFAILLVGLNAVADFAQANIIA